MKYLLIIFLFACYSTPTIEYSNSNDEHCDDECIEDRMENRMDGSDYDWDEYEQEHDIDSDTDIDDGKD